MGKKRTVAKPKNPKKRRAIWAAALVCLVALGIYAVHYCVRYQFNYEYRQFLPAPYALAEAGDFEPIEDGDPKIAGYSLASENDMLKMYVKADTGEVCVYDKRNGQAVYTNPPDYDKDKIAKETNKNYLRSQFMLVYYNERRAVGTYDSFSKCVDKGQLTCQSIDDGVRFTYVLDNLPKIEFFVPEYLSREKYDHVISFLEGKDRDDFARQFTDPDGDGIYVRGKSAVNNRRVAQKFEGYFTKAGFTLDDYYEQNALGSEGGLGAVVRFSVSLEYRLEGDHLNVSMPARLMTESGGAKIASVQLLCYLGAAGDTESGYMLLPNGSGSLMNFNNGKSNVAAYSQYIYDVDAIDADYTQKENTVPARLPLFAICREDSSVLATVETGSSMCYISADTAGRNNSYNNAYPTFILRNFQKMYMFGVTGQNADMPVMEDDMYDENFTVRYTLLTSEHAGYNGAANYYRERLLSEGALTYANLSGDIPFYYDVIGGVKQTAHFLGTKYMSVYPMTTFAQAGDMAAELKELGVTNQVMNLQGWFNGGYYHDVPDRVSVTGKLGGEDDLESLNARVKELGGELFADVAFQNVTFISKRFSAGREASRYYGAGFTAVLGQVNPGTLRRTSGLYYDETLYSLLSPRYLHEYVQPFCAEISDIDVSGISLRDLGDCLYADKRRTEVVTREQALSVVKAQLETISETGKDVMVSGGNVYALKNASHVINAPMSDTEFFILDSCVPFYQLVVHGCVEYAGAARNSVPSDDYRLDLLRQIEYGECMHFIFTHQDSNQMKYTGLNRDYSTTFDVWKQDACDMHAYVNDALSLVRDSFMTAHSRPLDDVSKTEYSNGVTIYVNYADSPAEIDGHTVPARDWAAFGGDGK